MRARRPDVSAAQAAVLVAPARLDAALKAYQALALAPAPGAQSLARLP